MQMVAHALHTLLIRCNHLWLCIAYYVRLKNLTIARGLTYRKGCIFFKRSNFGRYLVDVHHNWHYSLAPGPKPRRHITVNVGREINTTKGKI